MSDSVGGLVSSHGDDQALLDRGRTLVLSAFDEARTSGRSDWHVMTTAVLKNRLLNITRRNFDEREYGVSSMLDFVGFYPQLLSVDTNSNPPQITLLSTDLLPAIDNDIDLSPPRARTIIRPDLWRAMVDYASGDKYVWDTAAKIARVSDPDDSNPTLPTFSAEEVARLRVAFADREQTSQAVKSLLDEWISNNYGSNFLPRPLRGKWNGFFREALLERLHQRFADVGIEAPHDLVLERSRHEPISIDSMASSSSGVASLRELVHRCVAVMSERELTELKISPAIMMRALQRRK